MLSAFKWKPINTESREECFVKRKKLYTSRLIVGTGKWKQKWIHRNCFCCFFCVSYAVIRPQREIFRDSVKLFGQPLKRSVSQQGWLLWFVGKKVANSFLPRMNSIEFWILIFLMSELRIQFFRQFTSAANSNTLILAPLDNLCLPKSAEEHQELILLDISCGETANLLNSSWHELNDLAWILFKSRTMQPMDDQILSNFANISILPKSEIFYCSKDSESDRIDIKQVYRTAIDEPLTIEWMGVISNNNEFTNLRSTHITSRRRQNLRGVNLKAAMVVTSSETLNHLNDYRFVLTFDTLFAIDSHYLLAATLKSIR